MKAERAMEILASCGIDRSLDFHALRFATVDKLLSFAESERYQRPQNANGSRARYFHAMLIRVSAGGVKR